MKENEKNEKKLLGRKRLQPGQSLFCINLKTKEITDMGRPKRVDVQDGYVYRTALNRKNFIKKIERLGIVINKQKEEKI